MQRNRTSPSYDEDIVSRFVEDTEVSMGLIINGKIPDLAAILDLAENTAYVVYKRMSSKRMYITYDQPGGETE